MLYGYAGKILRIDLSAGRVSTEPLSEELAERFIAEQPESYLWSNRRWKKAPPEDYLRSKRTSEDRNREQDER